MKKFFLGSIAVCLASARLTLGQTAYTLPAPQVMPPMDSVGQPAATAGGDHAAPAETAGQEQATDQWGAYGPGTEVGHTDRFWFDAELLLWWIRGNSAPPLVTAGNAGFKGVLGGVGTVPLFNGGPLDRQVRPGARFTGGMWLDDDKDWAAEVSGFFLGQRSNGAVFGTDFGPILARPFLNLNAPKEDAILASFPGLERGDITVSNPSRLWGFETNVLKQLCALDCCYRVDVLAGFRYLDLDEAINIEQASVVNGNPALFPPGFGQFAPFAGDGIDIADRFATRNQFFGGQIGVDAAFSQGPLCLQLRGKIGLGSTHESITIAGDQAITTPAGATALFPGGVLALPSNVGHFTQDKFAFVPEVGANVGYRVRDWICLYVGYNFLYWSNVVRPADQIDRLVDVTQIPNVVSPATATGLARPAVPFKETFFWAHGVTVGVELAW